MPGAGRAVGDLEVVDLLEHALGRRVASSCLCGGYDDQLPPGVSTSQAISASASNASGVQKLLTCRLAAPAPRSSTGTASAGW